MKFFRRDAPLRRCSPVVLAAVFCACPQKGPPEGAPPAPKAPTSQPAAGAGPRYDRLDRATFNRVAARMALPIFWAADANSNGALEANETATLWGLPPGPLTLVVKGAFAKDFPGVYDAMVAASKDVPSAPTDDEGKRRALIAKELDQARPTLVSSDFSDASEQDRAIVKHVLEAARLVEILFARQNGVLGMMEQIPAADMASRMAFWRNQGPWCHAPATQDNPLCNALSSRPKRVVGVYPAAVQEDAAFCEKLAKRTDHDALLNPFVVVVDGSKDLKAVPYTQYYQHEMVAISAELTAAAGAITSDDEKAFKAYLLAAAQSFKDNNWTPADEAWAAMNVHNSRFYLRIGPDEVYWEPCSQKAGFHVSFARINQGSVAWQQKLEPVKGELETTLAAMAGKPYAARKVDFHLPDFIDLIINAGDSRSPMGATIGQSLPNWGPVADSGRGRTVVMVNFYTDPDSKQAMTEQAQSLFCKDTMPLFTTDEDAGIMSTVLHEAAHNLGPSHEYKVNGKKDSEAFGGPLASMLEELKAQTSALYLTGWLVEKKLVDATLADRSHIRDLTWAFGHISRGMYENGKPKAYSQLAAIQAGYLHSKGVLEWRAKQMAVNGTDTGCFTVHMDKFAAAAAALETTVLGIKARGDRDAGEKLRVQFVDAPGPWKDLMEVVTQRWLRQPKATFVYSVKM